MAGNLITYSGIITKSKAMGAKLISMEDYEHISQLENTADFLSFLKEQPGYKDIYSNFDEDTLHRGQIEHFLINALYMDCAKIYRFANPKQRRGLSFVFFRYEVSILKSCLQSVFNHEMTYDVSVYQPFFETYSKLDIQKLVDSKNIEEFISNLKGTEFYPLFTKMYDTNHHTLVEYEVQLDIYYFQKVWRLKNKKLKGQEKEAVTRNLGFQIDLLNIMWIYRSKKFYNMDISIIYASIIPIHYRISKVPLSKLVEANTLDEFMTVLQTTYYKELCSNESERFSMEQSYRRILNKIYRENKQKYPASMAPIYNFLHLKEQEIDQLTTALECIRYHLEPQEALQYIFN